MKKQLVLTAVASLLMLTIPTVFAAPITASLNWSSQTIVAGSHNIAAFTVIVDPDCLIGKTFSGTLTVIEPDGITTGTVTIGSTPCGTPLTADYPSDFAGSASTTTLGTYTAIWMGTTSVTIGGLHPEFRLQDNFVVKAFRNTVPEFQAPSMILAAIGLALILVVKKHSAKQTQKIRAAF